MVLQFAADISYLRAAVRGILDAMGLPFELRAAARAVQQANQMWCLDLI